ncbi:cell division ATP-binding protein FtsE [Desulfonispora thiosulfatigenes DSM 11270]|uniref:Cell division ATP-binding protein FtsE n=1 Tax=Desulfonispora thiosulfatigenes DSM 11270 TaxID=656914 RepID=A0A1W1UWQ5_DESTI|nr:cell division ATP-binding protein FtsE [Desulfonispora thiosulfatigenes]SMB85595.1 cell division ATP-binding protein FtsE [Desulfonispora thiosulfatigenes DSM 11270]
MIKLVNVTKKYGNNSLALENVELSIDKGEFVFLVGKSGAGKSTLLKLLTRQEKPTEGQIMVGGKSIVRLSNKEVPLYRRKIGVVFQDFLLLEDRTVFENVAFALEATGTSPKEVKKIVPQVLQKVGLAKKTNSFPNQLSGGEQQRVGIARAIVNRPEIIIADEPTGNLDPKTSKEIMRLLSDINERGTTILMATHDIEVVAYMRKRIIALKNGQVFRDIDKGGYEDADL